MALESRFLLGSRLLENRLHQQRRIHLHHSPLRRQHRGHPHWSSHHHPPTSTSSWMLSMTAKRFSSGGWTTLSAKGELLGWLAGFWMTQNYSLSAQRSRRRSQWLNASPIGAGLCWRR